MTDARPGFTTSARVPNDFELAEQISIVIDHWWENSGIDKTIVDVLDDSMTLDIGILKVVWNPDLHNNIGDVEIRLLDPRDLWVGKSARDFDKIVIGCRTVVNL